VIKTRDEINKLFKLKLTPEQYETIRKQLCSVGRTLHVDIVREIGASIWANNPLVDDDHAMLCSRTGDDELEVWTDGSAETRKKSVTYAVHWGRNHPLNYSRKMDGDSTTNDAELCAVLHVLTVLPLKQKVFIYTDSTVTMDVCAQIGRNCRTPAHITALTRRDSTVTTRIKRELQAVLLQRGGTETSISHVYSHLLDHPRTMDANTHEQRLREMQERFKDRYMHVLEGNAAADQMASDAHGKAAPILPGTSVMDPDFVAFSVHPTAQGNKIKRRLGQDIRRTVYDGRRATEVDGHKKRQRDERQKNPHTIAKDATCTIFDDSTDLRQSARVMQTWRTDPAQANVYNFLYRARRGALLEKEKALSRIDAEKGTQNKPLFTPRYGSKYSWNAHCPCCERMDERDCHVLTTCWATQLKCRHSLRSEVIDILKRSTKPQSHVALDALPAWFACGDDIAAPRAGANQHLIAIASYDKHLGTLAYVPSALIEWLRALEWKEDKAKGVHAAVMSVQMLLAARAHEAWIERCKMFEDQWRKESARRKKQKEDDDQREREARRASAAAAPQPSRPRLPNSDRNAAVSGNGTSSSQTRGGGARLVVTRPKREFVD
jgi:ribonuclease HI